jgi:hypothetical protein
MGFEVRELNENDYEDILVKWWKDWGFTPPSKEFLPENGAGGIMIMDDGIDVCAGFIYLTNSSVSWVDWIISDKGYRRNPKRREALSLLILTLTNICKNIGNKYVYALIKNDALINLYEDLGYTKADTHTKELIKTF